MKSHLNQFSIENQIQQQIKTCSDQLKLMIKQIEKVMQVASNGFVYLLNQCDFDICQDLRTILEIQFQAISKAQLKNSKSKQMIHEQIKTSFKNCSLFEVKFQKQVSEDHKNFLKNEALNKQMISSIYISLFQFGFSRCQKMLRSTKQLSIKALFENYASLKQIHDKEVLIRFELYDSRAQLYQQTFIKNIARELLLREFIQFMRAEDNYSSEKSTKYGEILAKLKHAQSIMKTEINPEHQLKKIKFNFIKNIIHKFANQNLNKQQNKEVGKRKSSKKITNNQARIEETVNQYDKKIKKFVIKQEDNQKGQEDLDEYEDESQLQNGNLAPSSLDELYFKKSIVFYEFYRYLELNNTMKIDINAQSDQYKITCAIKDQQNVQRQYTLQFYINAKTPLTPQFDSQFRISSFQDYKHISKFIVSLCSAVVNLHYIGIQLYDFSLKNIIIQNQILKVYVSPLARKYSRSLSNYRREFEIFLQWEQQYKEKIRQKLVSQQNLMYALQKDQKAGIQSKNVIKKLNYKYEKMQNQTNETSETNQDEYFNVSKHFDDVYPNKSQMLKTSENYYLTMKKYRFRNDNNSLAHILLELACENQTQLINSIQSKIWNIIAQSRITGISRLQITSIESCKINSIQSIWKRYPELNIFYQYFHLFNSILIHSQKQIELSRKYQSLFKADIIQQFKLKIFSSAGELMTVEQKAYFLEGIMKMVHPLMNKRINSKEALQWMTAVFMTPATYDLSEEMDMIETQQLFKCLLISNKDSLLEEADEEYDI